MYAFVMVFLWTLGVNFIESHANCEINMMFCISIILRRLTFQDASFWNEFICALYKIKTLTRVVPAALTFINLASCFCKVVRLAGPPLLFHGACPIHPEVTAWPPFSQGELPKGRPDASLLLQTLTSRNLPSPHTGPGNRASGPRPALPSAPTTPQPSAVRPPSSLQVPKRAACAALWPCLRSPLLGCTWLMPTLSSSLWALPSPCCTQCLCLCKYLLQYCDL